MSNSTFWPDASFDGCQNTEKQTKWQKLVNKINPRNWNLRDKLFLAIAKIHQYNENKIVRDVAKNITEKYDEKWNITPIVENDRKIVITAVLSDTKINVTNVHENKVSILGVKFKYPDRIEYSDGSFTEIKIIPETALPNTKCKCGKQAGHVYEPDPVPSLCK